MIIINAEDIVLGRIGTVAAKQALLGEEVRVVNCEKAIITGKKDSVIKDYRQQKERGTPAKGPRFFRSPERFVKRSIRGMLPYKKPRGRDAFKRIKCYNGLPEEFQGKDFYQLEGSSTDKLTTLKFITVGRLLERV